MKEEALRFNEGKIRMDLLEPFAMEQIGKVFTMGATKYAPRNWEKGMAWSKVISSLKRHLLAIEKGEDYDKESELLHAAHVSWNALALLSYYKIAPQYDDRNHAYLNHPRLALDIDDVLADWTGNWSLLHGIPRPTAWSFDRFILDKFDKMKYEGSINDFYLNLPILTKPEELPYEPVCYITSRPVETQVTEEWLDRNGFPAAPVCTVGIGGSKIDMLQKFKVERFVDDNFSNFVQANRAGICTFLFDRLHNQRYNVGFKRLHSLKELTERF